ncbi:MAG: 2-(1,2-epoxy-1,2-dihydrophenyl)acetyl-CoA isomerase PaaG [Enterobacterales bacterium]|nr:2-(1,2-epoxy-1,2-dihydrophenyl)acetyl-CoA isomerase PaaG [Enterobacterales bacterium]
MRKKNKAITKLTLNRPQRLNSFNLQMHQELQQALDDIATDGETRCVLITGAGRGFCAGQDLNDRSVNSEAAEKAKAPDLGKSVESFYNPLIRRITNLRMPVVCALNGVAAGAGASLVMACDIVIAARSASFILSFAKVGLVPDSGSSWHLARAIGMPRAKALALLGNKLKAEQAEQWGLIYQVVDDEQLVAESTQLVEHLATQPTEGLARTKKLIHSSFETSLNEQLEKERLEMQTLGRSHDYQEGVASFIEKREPKFKGC